MILLAILIVCIFVMAFMLGVNKLDDDEKIKQRFALIESNLRAAGIENTENYIAIKKLKRFGFPKYKTGDRVNYYRNGRFDKETGKRIKPEKKEVLREIEKTQNEYSYKIIDSPCEEMRIGGFGALIGYFGECDATESQLEKAEGKKCIK
jgi:hypothetical protein